MTPSNPNKSKSTCKSSRPTRWEIGLLVLVVVTGTALRISYLSRAAVEHFDEGVYASNIWFAEFPAAGSRYPAQHLYAPPLLPELVEGSITLFGSGHLGTLAVNLCFGSATIMMLWWVSRCWFGVAAGLSSATLVALSDFHILYSRTALTDPVLSFWMLAAVYLIWEALRRQCIGCALAAGMTTGLAWWTKYSGWLPLAIGLAGLVPWFLFRRWLFPDQSRHFSFGKSLGIWFVIAVSAFAVWSPVLYGLSDYGGYASVQANHRGYLVGLDGWIDSFRRQLAAHRHFDGWLSSLGLGLALLVGSLCCQQGNDRFTWNACVKKSALGIPTALWLIAAGLWFGSSMTLEICSVTGIVWLLITNLRKQKNGSAERALAGWLVAAWFCGLLVATPFYRAYPRLTLPWLLCSWLATGVLFDTVITALRAGIASRKPDLDQKTLWLTSVRLGLGAALLIAIAAATGGQLWQVAGWQDRSGLESIARQIIADSSQETPETAPYGKKSILYIYGEPALFYHISAQGSAAAPIADLGFAAPQVSRPEIPTFLISGPHAVRSPDFQAQLKQTADRFELIATYDYLPSDLVLLNKHSASKLHASDFDRREQIQLYRLK